MNIGEYWPSQYIMLHSPKKILANIHAIALYCDLCIILVYVCMMLAIIGGGTVSANLRE